MHPLRISIVPAWAAVVFVLALCTAPPASAVNQVSAAYSQVCQVYSGVGCGFTQVVGQWPTLSYAHTYEGQNIDPTLGTFTHALSTLTIEASPSAFHVMALGLFDFEDSARWALPDDVTYANAKADLTGTDGIHFHADSLAPGTPVSFVVHSTLDSSVSGGCNNFGSVNVYFALFGNHSILKHDGCGAGSDHMSAATTFVSVVDGQFDLESRLIVTAGSGVTGQEVLGVTSLHVSHRADAAHTASLWIEVLTPGVSFVSDSGASYAAPVPEPSTPLLLGLGGALLGLQASQRRPRNPFARMPRARSV